MALIITRRYADPDDPDSEIISEVEGGEFPDEHNFGAGYFKKAVEDGIATMTFSLNLANGSVTYELYDFEAPDTFKFRKAGTDAPSEPEVEEVSNG